MLDAELKRLEPTTDVPFQAAIPNVSPADELEELKNVHDDKLLPGAVNTWP